MEKSILLVRDARAIAVAAHAGQFDLAGMPYIDHVERVALSVSSYSGYAETVALLHDVPEDAPEFAYLLAAFPAHIQIAVHLLTRRPDTPDFLYYARIKANPLARAVKLADIHDNINPDRLAMLPKQVAERLAKKYSRALQELNQ